MNLSTDRIRFALNESTAILSDDRVYRYALIRKISASKGAVLFIGLNPSTADETIDDPTIRRCMGFVKDWGMGLLWMGNLFAYRATDRTVMKRQGTGAIGPENDDYLRVMIREATLVIAAWGNDGVFLQRGNRVRDMLRHGKCFGYTKQGEPKHPLYLRRDAVLVDVPWGKS